MTGFVPHFSKEYQLPSLELSEHIPYFENPQLSPLCSQETLNLPQGSYCDSLHSSACDWNHQTWDLCNNYHDMNYHIEEPYLSSQQNLKIAGQNQPGAMSYMDKNQVKMEKNWSAEYQNPWPVTLGNIQEYFISPQKSSSQIGDSHSLLSFKKAPTSSHQQISILPSTISTWALDHPQDPEPLNAGLLNDNSLQAGISIPFDQRQEPVLEPNFCVPPFNPNLSDMTRYVGQRWLASDLTNSDKFDDQFLNGQSAGIEFGIKYKARDSCPPNSVSIDLNQIEPDPNQHEMHLDRPWKLVELQDPILNFPFSFSKKMDPEFTTHRLGWWNKAERDRNVQRLMRGNMEDTLRLFGPEDSYSSNQVMRLYLLLWRAAGFSAEELQIPHQKLKLQIGSFEFLTSLLHLKGLHELDQFTRAQVGKIMRANSRLNQYAKLWKYMMKRHRQIRLDKNNPVFDILCSFFQFRAEFPNPRIGLDKFTFQSRILERFDEGKRR
ncbi:hypothetical protein DFH28DRAFT_931402 [Melampsora americana]|nr:hypothetical protein DFH28DRAFT_931402 [Melampsora americana]